MSLHTWLNGKYLLVRWASRLWYYVDCTKSAGDNLQQNHNYKHLWMWPWPYTTWAHFHLMLRLCLAKSVHRIWALYSQPFVNFGTLPQFYSRLLWLDLWPFDVILTQCRSTVVAKLRGNYERCRLCGSQVTAHYIIKHQSLGSFNSKNWQFRGLTALKWYIPKKSLDKGL